MKKFLLLVALVFATNNLFAETGKELLEVTEKAMGHDKAKEFNTRRIESSMTQSGMNIGVVFYLKDDKVRVETSFMGQEMVVVVADGACFQLKPNYQELPFEQSQQIFAQLSMFVPNVVEFQEGIPPDNIVLVGTADFQGKPAKKVQLTEEGGETFLFIDPITNWLLGVNMPAMGIELVYDSMKRVKGFVYPSVIKVMQGGQVVSEVNINKFEVNIDLPDSLFAKE